MKKSSSNQYWQQKGVALVLVLGLFAGVLVLSNFYQTAPATSGTITGNVLKVSERDMWNLNLTNFLLTQLYDQAYSLAVMEIPDAKLSEFDIDVFPYTSSSKVRLTYCFYSAQTDRELDYFFSDKLEISLERDISDITIVNRITFDTCPWITNKEWLSFIRKACERVELINPDIATGYLVWVVNRPETTWNINIREGVNYHWSLFKWDGDGDPVLTMKFNNDVVISHLIYYP